MPNQASTRRIRYSAGEVKRNLFYKFPKYLLLDPEYKGLSANAKITYMVLLDRHQLSIKNGMVDNKGHVYLILSRAELQSLVGVSENIAMRIMNELKAIGLVEETRRGQGKPNLIYLLAPKNPNLPKPKNPDSKPAEEDFRTADNAGLDPQMVRPQSRISYGPKPSNGAVASYSKTYISKTDVSERGMDAGPPAPDGGQAAPPQKNEKEAYGNEFKTVRLHPWEYSGLVKMFTEEVAKDYIDRLDAHKASKGKKYANDYATIYKWIMEDNRKATKKTVQQPKQNRFINFNQRENDYAELEKLERAHREQKYKNFNDNPANGHGYITREAGQDENN